MKKFQLNQFKGATRVVIKTTKGFTMYIDNPTIMVSEKNDDSFVVFGEIKYANLGNDIKKMKTQVKSKVNEIKEEQEEEEEDESVVLDKGDLDENDINELISYSGCTRNKAIRLLKKSNGDLVEALSKV